MTIPKKELYCGVEATLLACTAHLGVMGTDSCRPRYRIVTAAQNHLSNLRHVHHHQPVFQSLSRHNRRAERIWPEINQRINYPIKRVLIELEEVNSWLG